MKILSVGAELFHADRQMDGHTDGEQTDRHGEANSTFRKYTNAPKTVSVFVMAIILRLVLN
jgi:hypothetical protein